MCIPLKKSSVNKNELLGGKTRGKIRFLGSEKETQGVGREIFEEIRIQYAQQ
jgi:hypothetical protein